MPQPKGDRADPARCYSEGVSDPFPALSGEVDCDALIVGAGVTGASAALALARAGRDVVVIDEAKVGAGGSGRAFGQVVAFGKHAETWYRKSYGADLGQTIIDWLATGPDVVFGLIEEFGIACAARRSGVFVAAHHPKAERGLRARADYWSRRGHDVAITEADETRQLTGSPFYDLSLWDRRAGSINPLAYSLGLAKAAARMGARVFTDTGATRLETRNGRWRIDVKGGAINARTVAICTNAYSGRLWPKLQRSVVPMRSYQLVSKPLGAAVRGDLLPGGQSIMDTRRTFSAVRIFDDGRLHLSVPGPSTNVRGTPDIAAADKRIRDLFPQLGTLEWEQGWTGWVGVNMAQEPRLSQLDDGLFGVAGYSGRGLAYGTLMGGEVAKRLIDPRHPEAIFPVRPVFPLPGHAFAPAVVRQVLHYYSFLDDRDLRVQRNAARARGRSS